MNQGPADPQNQSGLGAGAEEVRQESEEIQDKEGAAAVPEVAERRPDETEEMDDWYIADGEKEEIYDLLRRLTLEGKRDTLTRAHFLEIIPSILQNEEPNDEKDLVPAFMQRLLTVDYRARHIFVNEKPTALKPHTAGKGAFGALFKKKVRIHPMDIQMAVFLRADLFLRQTMVTKLSQCQYAVPLLVPNPLSQNLEFPLWTLREISKSWKTTDTSGKVISKSLPMWKAETPMVTFFRIGSISSSKSQMINRLINERHDTFFHRDSPGSSKKCLLMDGVVEIAWYLPSGRSTDHFSDCVAFCNLHGDSSTNEPQRKILTEKASVNVVLLPKLDENDNNMVIVQKLWEDPKPLIVVITDEEEEDEDDDEDVVHEIGERKYRVTLKGRNPSDVSAALREVIRDCLSQNPVTFRFEEMTDHSELKVDEGSEDCKRGKEAAQQIMKCLENEDPSTVKGKYLPCQGKLWHDWCKKNKDLRLQGNNLETEKIRIEQEMREMRKKLKEHGFSELMELFVGNLNSLSGCEKMYFLKWTEILLNDFTSDKLCTLHQQYYRKWAEVLHLKKTHDKESNKSDKLKAEQSHLEKISNKLNEATFGLEHMLRETGQIYEASVSVKRGMRRNEDLSYLPDLAAELMISGHPVELMDGDAAHVPLIWVSAVLDKVIKKLGDPRVFVLSVLGIQSSGKSTMLNAMFGLQFAVSAGRCTRGAFMQLVKVSEEMKKEMKEWMKEVLKLDYILVVDTEGFRALEMAGKNTIHHDNELATFVVGLGNMTLINIFGENPSEMQDILQIVVQAFMRMKKVRLNPSCMFVHQNVTDVAASERMMEGRRRLQENLDEMTKLAAKEEVCAAECFSDVIAFDVQKDVKYFAQLWEGSPPMAPPNPSYCENVQKLKRDIVSRASKTDSMKLSQFQQRVEDLWNALLNENFLFSFKNVDEKTIYRKLEEECEKWTWSLRSNMLSVEQKMFNRIASGKVETVEKQELVKEMSNTLKEVQKDFTAYTEKTLIQWKSRFETQIQNLHDELINEAKTKLHENIQQKNSKKNLDNQRMNHEKALLEKSKELALKLKEKRNEERDPTAEFDLMWWKWVSELTKDAPELKDVNISDDVSAVLGELYESGRVLQQKESAEYRKICNTGNYQNYVSMKQNKTRRLMWEKSLKPEDQRSIQELISKVIQKTREKVNSLPVYNKSYIQEIARDVKHTVQNFKPDGDSFQFKPEFSVDLSLYVFEQAEKRLAELHRKYREDNDPLFYIEMKRPEYFKVFMNYWHGAESAVVLGDRICGKLRETVLQSVYNMIAHFISGEMRGTPPFTGNRADLEKHFLKTLAEQEGDQKQRFKNFRIYLYQPKIYFESFIKDKVKEFMAAENPRAVSVIREHIEHKQRKIISAAETARDEVRRTNGDVNMWLGFFSNSLIDELGDTRVLLSDDVSQGITDCDVLVEFMRKEFPAVAEELKGSFRKLSDLRMEKFRERPEVILIQHFCRCCWEQCPFCGAVCTNSQGDHTGDHSVDFHRSGGVTGQYYRGTTEMRPDFCTTLVASDQSFYPELDSKKSVPFKQYRTAGGKYAKWLISTDFSTLAYWKWFVCEFQQNLEEHHKKYFRGRGAIPAEWRKISQSDAIESLGLK